MRGVFSTNVVNFLIKRTDVVRVDTWITASEERFGARRDLLCRDYKTRKTLFRAIWLKLLPTILQSCRPPNMMTFYVTF